MQFWKLTLDVVDTAAAAIGDELARNAQMYLGHHGHLLTIPIEKGKTMNVVAFKTKADGQWTEPQYVMPSKRDVMLKDFEDWSDTVREIVAVSD